MSRVSPQPRGSVSFGQTLKRKREEDDERQLGRCSNSPDSSANDSHAEVVEWELAFGHPHTLTIMHKEYATQITDVGVQLGTVRETVKSDGTTATFQGTAMTALEIRFTLLVGHMTVKWMGGRIIIDETYSIDENNFVMNRRPPRDSQTVRTIKITSGGGWEEPMTLIHAKRSYIIRYEEGYPAMVIPRSAYYPLKLLMMKDFLDKFVPKELFGRSSQAPAELSDDPRIPNATPNTPDSFETSDESIDDLTPPSQYEANERGRMYGYCVTDDSSDE